MQAGGCNCKLGGGSVIALWRRHCILGMQLHFVDAVAFWGCSRKLGGSAEAAPPPQHPWVVPGGGSSCCHPQTPPDSRVSLHTALTSLAPRRAACHSCWRQRTGLNWVDWEHRLLGKLVILGSFGPFSLPSPARGLVPPAPTQLIGELIQLKTSQKPHCVLLSPSPDPPIPPQKWDQPPPPSDFFPLGCSGSEQNHCTPPQHPLKKINSQSPTKQKKTPNLFRPFFPLFSPLAWPLPHPERAAARMQAPEPCKY